MDAIFADTDTGLAFEGPAWTRPIDRDMPAQPFTRSVQIWTSDRKVEALHGRVFCAFGMKNAVFGRPPLLEAAFLT
jgi:hypothetical protein